MTATRLKRIALLLPFGVFFTATAVINFPRNGMKIYWSLSPKDVAEIQMVHRNSCERRIGPGWYQRFCPTGIRLSVAGALNPIEGIYVQSNGSAIVVYRSWQEKFYDRSGEHHWALESFTLVKATNGWEWPVVTGGFP
jgi:hypothetical protein